MLVQIKQQLLESAQKLASTGLSQGTSGNISIRVDNQVVITPSGANYNQLNAEDMAVIPLSYDPQRDTLPGLPPSSEWRFHTAIYHQRPDINAVVHGHPTAATALACTGRSIPAFHYMVAVAGGCDIPLAPYALFGTQALSQHVVNALFDRKACLLENHGMIAIGNHIDAAFALALEVENLAKQYCEALKIGNVRYLSDEQMAAVIERFKDYGQYRQ